MSTPTRSVPVVLDAAAVDDLPLEPLGNLHGVRHRVLWSDQASMSGVMVVDAGHHLGAHKHRRHHHHVWVIDGQARILGQDLGAGSYVHIPVGVEHDVDATATDGCAFLYLYLDQDPGRAEAAEER